MKVGKLIPSLLLALTAAMQSYAAPYYTNKVGDMVWDKETQLVWARCQLGQKWDVNNCSGNASEYKFDNAQEVAKNFNLGGHTDWVMPTIRQLLTLRMCSNGFNRETVDLRDGKGRVPKGCSNDSANPAIDFVVFPNTHSSTVWSISPDSLRSNPNDSKDSVWLASIWNGSLIPNFMLDFSWSVWLVRNRQLSDSERALDFSLQVGASPAQIQAAQHKQELERKEKQEMEELKRKEEQEMKELCRTNPVGIIACEKIACNNPNAATSVRASCRDSLSRIIY